MADLLGPRSAPVIAVLAQAERPLRLAEIARITDAPLSSTQRVVDGLLKDGILVRSTDARPRYRLAPDVPRPALEALVAWRLGERATRDLRQRAASTRPVPSLPSIEERTREVLIDPEQQARLQARAQRLIWWQTPEESLRQPVRLVLQAMAIGSWVDATLITDLYGDDRLRDALALAPPGVFGPAAWSYWHRRLGYERIPPLPERDLT